MDDPTAALVSVIVLGVAAQWVALRLRVPAILVLLGAGLAAGPGLGLVDPDALLGPLLLPVVSLGVGLLLFEGGLGLHLSELGAWRGALLRLLTVGVVATGATATVAAVTVGRLPLDGAVVFGAMMTVTGPTVIVPLLRQVRLRPRVARVLRWEGIFVDAIGATLAIVAVEAVLADGGAGGAIRLAGLTVLTGAAIGILVALALSLALGRGLVPDHTEIAVIVMSVLFTFAVSNHLHEESGLLATTVMGVVLANQRRAPVRHVIEFHESLGTLLVGGLFILLSARVDPAALRGSLLPGLGIVVVLVVVGRPLAVALSTIATSVPRNERLFLAGMAPRGIVAASVSEVLALRLEEAGNTAGADLAAVTFVVVAGTVVAYGLSAGPLSRRLRVGMPVANGVALIGAPPWAIDVAVHLVALDVAVLVVTTDEREVRMARHADLLVYDGSFGDRDLAEAFEALGISQVLCVSAREEMTLLAHNQLGPVVGRTNVYELPEDASTATGTRTFGGGLDLAAITTAISHGARITMRRGDAPSEGFRALIAVGGDTAPSVSTDVGGAWDCAIGLARAGEERTEQAGEALP